MIIVFDTLAKILFFFVLIMGLVVVLIWMERKGSAFIQDRTGPCVQRREAADDAGLALGDHEIRIGDDEERRSDDRETQILENGGQCHEKLPQTEKDAVYVNGN